LIALACSVNAQGSTFISAPEEGNPQKSETSSGYTVTVSAGQAKNAEASANLTIAGANSQVNVEKVGTVTLVAGKSIVLHPGTKISAGSFLYASIEPAGKGGKHPKKGVRLVTVEENKKIEEQASLSYAVALFNPFPTHRKGILHAGDAENGSFTSSIYEITGVSPEQQRKVAIDSHMLTLTAPKQILTSVHLLPVAYAYRPEVAKVLRL
jgi:hypothetical protein